MKVAEYKVVKDRDVVKYLDEGWVMHGGGFASHTGYFMQPMLRYVDETAAQDTETINDTEKPKKRSGFFSGR